MNYATGYAFNVNQLFLTFPTKKMKLTSKACEELIGNRNKEVIAKAIFKHSIKLVLDDIINNNVTFDLPTNKRKAELKMLRTTGENFATARRNGKWLNVDFLASNFAGYQVGFTFQSKGVMRTKLVYLNSANRDMITANTNNGKQYF